MSPIAQRLQTCLQGTAVLVGIGNRWRGDDAAGPEVIARLAGRAKARCIDAGDAPERHLGEAAEGTPDSILLVDAVDFGGLPGEVAVFGLEDLPVRLGTTHDVPLSVLMGYLRAMTGADVLLLGIQPETTGFGTRMSAAVDDAVGVVTDVLLAQLGEGPTVGTCACLSDGSPQPLNPVDSICSIPCKGTAEGGQRR
ncbi:MAG: hydrogenase 3 maturation endopeptidase HyCI [Armatimonadetes bacterium]|nr:hydrogenase 3 maturation endopeptidase HyCI [Armatimonadota bacterium]